MLKADQSAIVHEPLFSSLSSFKVLVVLAVVLVLVVVQVLLVLVPVLIMPRAILDQNDQGCQVVS